MIYAVRLILILLFLALVGIYGIIFCLIRPFNPHNLRIISNSLWRGIQILGIKLEVRNEEELNKFPCVIISNHQENMDVFIGARMIPDKTVSVGKKSILYIPFFGLFYWLSGNILIDRSSRKNALGAMEYAAKQITDRNISVWILAEGTRSRGRGVLPFKKGAFVTAIKAQVPISLIAISSYNKSVNIGKWNAGKIIVEVLPSISTIGMNIDQVNELKDECHRLVKQRVEELDLELTREQA